MNDFDYIVVGGGSAGCVIASRLSENSAHRVLLLEAGADNKSWKIDMPGAVGMLVSSDKYNWAYSTVPESSIGGRVVDIARGKVLGGSSSINGMVYTRGHSEDFNEWANELGCEGWDYENVLPYFKRAETSDRGASEYRGGQGPLSTITPSFTDSPINKAWFEAGKAAGFSVVNDSNAEVEEGFCPSEKTIKAGVRWSTAKAYLTDEVRRRENLTIYTQCSVRKVLLNNKVATGVEISLGGRIQRVFARREIVLSAGAVDSPKVLLLSGIGPRKQLEELGIDVLHELEGVGENLQDHPDVSIQFRCTEKAASLYGLTKFPTNIAVGAQWFITKTGAAATNHFDASAFIKTRRGLSKPNIKFELLPLAFKPESFSGYNFPTFQVHCALMTAESRGTISLASSDPGVPAKIQINFLKEDIDRQSLREAIVIAREIVGSAPFSPYAGEELEPGKSVSSEKELNDWIDKRVTTSWHLSGSCKMGKASDRLAVVDNHLKVIGVQSLRIADASIMPVVVSANTNAATIMIGEYASDLIQGKRIAG